MQLRLSAGAQSRLLDGTGVVVHEDTEVVNTAILTGRRVAMPIKLVTVETDGQVREVDDSVTCSSTDVDVLKPAVSLNRRAINIGKGQAVERLPRRSRGFRPIRWCLRPLRRRSLNVPLSRCCHIEGGENWHSTSRYGYADVEFIFPDCRVSGRRNEHRSINLFVVPVVKDQEHK
ncbi:hypothetical protein F2P81_014234 [Scophthalmus maximus]|uniref:Transmembrane protein family 132 fourth domain-containing protein n=1 Tax=Scophthalmus maximus TaxID=52904 RepID=A0A6A4SPX4_SCOMX|nr:hypothetical protein F2P81_014234 [Scophthalmus maximus]